MFCYVNVLLFMETPGLSLHHESDEIDFLLQKRKNTSITHLLG